MSAPLCQSRCYRNVSLVLRFGASVPELTGNLNCCGPTGVRGWGRSFLLSLGPVEEPPSLGVVQPWSAAVGDSAGLCVAASAIRTRSGGPMPCMRAGAAAGWAILALGNIRGATCVLCRLILNNEETPHPETDLSRHLCGDASAHGLRCAERDAAAAGAAAICSIASRFIVGQRRDLDCPPPIFRRSTWSLRGHGPCRDW